MASTFEQDIYKVAERKRGEADRVRFDLNAALKDLYLLQSQVMTLERENAIIDAQLKRKAEAPPSTVLHASSKRPVGASALAASKPAGGVSLEPLTTGGLMAAVYQTDSIKRLVDELDGIKLETADIDFRGQIYEHMRARLAEEAVDCRRQTRLLQDRVQEERGKFSDLHRKEMELLRHVATAQQRLTDMRRGLDDQLSQLRLEIRERSGMLKRKREFNSYLEVQITSPAGPAVTFIGMPPRPVSNDDKKRLAVQVLTSRTLKRSISNAVTEAESDEARYLDALRAMRVPIPAGLLDAALQHSTTGTAGGTPAGRPGSGSRKLRTPALTLGGSLSTGSLGRTGAATAATARKGERGSPTLDADFLVNMCLQQDSIRRSLLQRMEAEEARMTAMQEQQTALRAPMRGALSPLTSTTLATTSLVESKRDGSSMFDASTTELAHRPASASHRPSNRDLAEREKEVTEWEKQLQMYQGENDFLLTAVMPVRLGVAGMARKILGGVGVTVTDASEMQYELGRLSVKCAAIVEEIKKAVTLADPEGHNIVDWATLQALELTEALEASKKSSPTHKTVAAARAAASEAAASPYISPYNIRVAPGEQRVLATKNLRQLAEEAGLARTSLGSEEEEEDESGSGEGEDDRGDVLNRAELKKMSQKLLRYRRRVTDHQALAVAAGTPPPTTSGGSSGGGGTARPSTSAMAGTGSGSGEVGGSPHDSSRAQTRRLLSRGKR